MENKNIIEIKRHLVIVEAQGFKGASLPVESSSWQPEATSLQNDKSQMIHKAFLIGEEVLKVKKLINFQPLESKEKLLFVSHIEAHQENKRTTRGILID